jgi:predicted ATPase
MTSSENMTEAEANLMAAEDNASKIPIFKFILTGGPCGGKTTAIARLSYYLKERGFEVIACAEVYTILASNGMSFDFYSTEGMDTVIQNSVLDVQLSLEDSLERVLKARGKPAVLLCDRGPMDGKAYLSEEKWKKILDERGVTEADLRDTRYNAVFHMVTAADGASAFYTLENNQARSETAEQARDLDKRSQKCWLGHAHMYVLDNSTDFESKLQRLVNIVSKLVGLPTNLSKRSAKYLLCVRPNTALFPEDVDYHRFEVEKVYILVQNDEDSGAYSFIRKRTTIDKDGEKQGSVYQLTDVVRKNGEIFETKRIISGREYNASYKSRDPSRYIVRQERISFLYKSQSFTIHVFEQPSPGLCILHAQVESNDNETPMVELPEFLDIDRPLGENDETVYGSYALSVINK